MTTKSERRASGLGKHLLAAAVSTVVTMSIFLSIDMLAGHYSTGSAIYSTAQWAT